jgi:hypothetical protein
VESSDQGHDSVVWSRQGIAIMTSVALMMTRTSSPSLSPRVARDASVIARAHPDQGSETRRLPRSERPGGGQAAARAGLTNLGRLTRNVATWPLSLKLAFRWRSGSCSAL